MNIHPTPWRLSLAAPTKTRGIDILGPTDHFVASVPYPAAIGDWNKEHQERARATARLIAAAPTMADYIEKRAANGDADAQRIMELIHGHA